MLFDFLLVVRDYKWSCFIEIWILGPKNRNRASLLHKRVNIRSLITRHFKNDFSLKISGNILLLSDSSSMPSSSHPSRATSRYHRQTILYVISFHFFHIRIPKNKFSHQFVRIIIVGYCVIVVADETMLVVIWFWVSVLNSLTEIVFWVVKVQEFKRI